MKATRVELDRDFGNRSLVTSLAVGGLFLLWLVQTLNGTWILSFLFGLALAAALLKTQEWTSEMLLGGRKRMLAALLVVKYVLIGAAFWFMVEHSLLNPFLFLTGFVIVQFVMILKAVAINMQNRDNLKSEIRRGRADG